MGFDYSYVGVTNKGNKLYVAQATAKDADKSSSGERKRAVRILNDKFFLSARQSYERRDVQFQF